MGDRGGGREAKGSSLKVSKKNPGSSVAKAKKAAAPVAATAKKIKTTHALISAIPSEQNQYVDTCCAILSRQFDRDRDRVLLRAKQEGVFALLCWFADMEKLDELSAFCKTNSGFAYFMAGVHPDNIDKTNKKQHDVWMQKVETVATEPECVG